MQTAFHKISIDFEYLNEIYNINSDPYNTLSELKEIVSKKYSLIQEKFIAFIKIWIYLRKKMKKLLNFFQIN